MDKILKLIGCYAQMRCQQLKKPELLDNRFPIPHLHTVFPDALGVHNVNVAHTRLPN